MPFISPVAVTVGVEVARHHRVDDGVEQESTEPDLDASVGYRLVLSDPRRLAVMLGMRAGLSHDSAFNQQRGNTTNTTVDSSMYSVDLGVVVGFELDRFWVTPWVGRHIGTRTDHYTYYKDCVTMCTITETDFPIGVPTLASGGVLFGYDVWTRGLHRASVFVSAQSSSTIRDMYTNHAQYHYSAYGVGIAYRL